MPTDNDIEATRVKTYARHWQRVRVFLYILGGALAFGNVRDFQMRPLDVSIFALFLLLVSTETCPFCRRWARSANVFRLMFGRDTCPECTVGEKPNILPGSR